MKPDARFLVVDDDERLRTALSHALESRGYQVRCADGPPSALALVAQWTPHYAVIDLRMPEGSGLDLVQELLKTLPDLPMVMLTGYGSISTAVDAVRLGALNYLTKPADVDTILAAFTPKNAMYKPTSDYPAPSLARAEWEHIQRVLNDYDGNITRAAKQLGLHRRTLQRKLRQRPPKQ